MDGAALIIKSNETFSMFILYFQVHVARCMSSEYCLLPLTDDDDA